MKKFEAKVVRGDIECRYIVKAIDAEHAAKRIFEISGERQVKVTER